MSRDNSKKDRKRKRISKDISSEVGKGTKQDKAVAIALSKESKRKKDILKGSKFK